MISSLAPLAAAAQQPSANAAATAADPKDPLTSKDTFLRLLVAQLQNQNPLDPSDPIEFMTQLTQFSTLEQSLGAREELASIRSTVEEWAKRAQQTAAAPTAAP